MSKKPPLKKENSQKIDDQKLYPIRIEDITEEGEGVGRIDGMTVFVHNTLPGDYALTKLIKVKKNYAIGIVNQMLEHSEKRITAPCPYARLCGGCQLQEYDYSAQVEFKRNTLKNAIERIGGITDYAFDDFIGMENPSRYRNKGIYQIAHTKHGLEIGFYRKRSHDIVDVKNCMLQTEATNELLEKFRGWVQKSGVEIYNEITGEGILRRVMIRDTQKGDGMMLVVVVAQKDANVLKLLKMIEEDMPKTLKSVYLNYNGDPGNTALSYDYEHVFGDESIVDTIGEAKFKISPQSFFQINRVQTKALYDVVVRYAKATFEEGKEGQNIGKRPFNVLDLYCGIGSIGIYLSKYFQTLDGIIGVEIVENAILDARLNAEFNALTNTNYHVGKAEDIMPALKAEGIDTDLVILDPPRKGCEQSLLETLVEMDVQNIIYVSCKPSTLARDLKFLAARGYKIERGTGVDMFPWTGHVETVVLLSHKKSQASSPSL